MSTPPKDNHGQRYERVHTYNNELTRARPTSASNRSREGPPKEEEEAAMGSQRRNPSGLSWHWVVRYDLFLSLGVSLFGALHHRLVCCRSRPYCAFSLSLARVVRSCPVGRWLYRFCHPLPTYEPTIDGRTSPTIDLESGVKAILRRAHLPAPPHSANPSAFKAYFAPGAIWREGALTYLTRHDQGPPGRLHSRRTFCHLTCTLHLQRQSSQSNGFSVPSPVAVLYPPRPHSTRPLLWPLTSPRCLLMGRVAW